MKNKKLIIMSTFLISFAYQNSINADIWSDAKKKLTGGKNSIINKPGGTGKKSVNKTLTDNKNNLDKSLTDNKNNLDKSLTDNKTNTDKDLEGLKRNLVTEIEYFIGTTCGESGENKALERKFNQGEISSSEYEKEKEQLAKAGKAKGCSGGGVETTQNGDVTALDKNGVPSEKAVNIPESSSTNNTLPSDSEIVAWNAKQEMHDLFTNEESNHFSFWTFSSTNDTVGFGYFERSPSSKMTTTVTPSRPPSKSSTPSRSPIVHIIKLMKLRAQIQKDAIEYGRFSADIENLRKTKTDTEISEYTVVYQGNSYYGLAKIETHSSGPQLKQGNANYSDPTASELKLRSSTPLDTIPFKKATIYPAIDFYKARNPDVKSDDILTNIKNYYDAVPKEQHDKEWKEIERNTKEFLY